eukprot:TRINITY_DN238_c3_g1_i2.p1 TRINITY_DN238_c3_g1~~TRINITY_DN238_c3_g1_i2.p1  ORF type:complete len:582 (+),score=185.96 TRINITY_DN238_c3_g1_i2:45-1748(+)
MEEDSYFTTLSIRTDKNSFSLVVDYEFPSLSAAATQTDQKTIVIDPLDQLFDVSSLLERLIVDNPCIDASHVDDVAVALYELQDRFREFVGDEIGSVEDGCDDLIVDLNLLSQMFPSLDLSVISSVCSVFPSGSADKIVSCLLDLSDDANANGNTNGAMCEDESSSYCPPIGIDDVPNDMKIDEELALLQYYLPSFGVDEIRSFYDAYDGDVDAIVRDIGGQDSAIGSSKKRSRRKASKRGHRKKGKMETISLGDFKKIAKEEEEEEKKKTQTTTKNPGIIGVVPETPTWVDHSDDLILSSSRASTTTTTTKKAQSGPGLSMPDRLMIWDMQKYYSSRVPDSVIQHTVVLCKGVRDEVMKELDRISGMKHAAQQHSTSHKKSHTKKTTKATRLPAPQGSSLDMHRTSSTMSAGVVAPSHSNVKKFSKLLEDRATINIDLMRIRNQHGHVHALDIKDRMIDLLKLKADCDDKLRRLILIDPRDLLHETCVDIDLHGCTVEDSQVIIRRHIAFLRKNNFATKSIRFVTGKGTHSYRGIPVLFPFLTRWCRAMKYRVSTEDDACIVIDTN